MEIETIITLGANNCAETQYLNVRPPGIPVREVEFGETLEVRGGSALVLLDTPIGEPPVVEGLSITPRALGRYRVRVDDLDEDGKVRAVATLHLLVFEPACIDRIPEMQRSGRSSPRSRGERRLIIRSIASSFQYIPEFDGRAETITRGLHPAFGC